MSWIVAFILAPAMVTVAGGLLVFLARPHAPKPQTFSVPDSEATLNQGELHKGL